MIYAHETSVMNRAIPQRVLIATQNSGKLREFRRLLKHIPAQFVGLDELPSVAAPREDGLTFFDNARIKARFYAQHFGEFALADDSGLVVDALDGAPGVRSARYGGDGLSDEDRTDLVLSRMSGIPLEKRTARFVCAAVVCGPSMNAKVLHTLGTVEGRIAFEKRGINGFGYDPIFVPDGETVTTAQMGSEEKDRLSHRGNAIRAIAPSLERLLLDN